MTIRSEEICTIQTKAWSREEILDVGDNPKYSFQTIPWKILKNEDFIFHNKEEKIHIGIISVEELGFGTNTSLGDICSKVESSTVECESIQYKTGICFPIHAIDLLLNYKNFKHLKSLYVLTKPIVLDLDEQKHQFIFNLVKQSEDILLTIDGGAPECLYEPKHEFAIQLYPL